MKTSPPSIYIARHGETAWSLTGQHTGLTDLPLTAAGEGDALRLGLRLRSLLPSQVFCSPLARARRTCELAGFGPMAELSAALLEWNYGEYEGLRSAEIQMRRPGWKLFRDGCPGGESPTDVAARADRFIEQLRAVDGPILLFASGHISRALAVRWLDQPIASGAQFLLSTASLSILSYDHGPSEPAIQLWNDISHLTPRSEGHGLRAVESSEVSDRP